MLGLIKSECQLPLPKGRGLHRNDLVVGKRNSYQQSSLDYFGFQTGLYITTRGCEIENNMLECLTQDMFLLFKNAIAARCK